MREESFGGRQSCRSRRRPAPPQAPSPKSPQQLPAGLPGDSAQTPAARLGLSPDLGSPLLPVLSLQPGAGGPLLIHPPHPEPCRGLPAPCPPCPPGPPTRTGGRGAAPAGAGRRRAPPAAGGGRERGRGRLRLTRAGCERPLPPQRPRHPHGVPGALSGVSGSPPGPEGRGEPPRRAPAPRGDAEGGVEGAVGC